MRAKFFTRPTAWPWNTTAVYDRAHGEWSSTEWVQSSVVNGYSSPQLWYLRGFSRAHHSPQRVVQLSGFCQFSVSTNRRVDTTEVRKGGSKGKTVQHLQAQKRKNKVNSLMMLPSLRTSGKWILASSFILENRSLWKQLFSPETLQLWPDELF